VTHRVAHRVALRIEHRLFRGDDHLEFHLANGNAMRPRNKIELRRGSAIAARYSVASIQCERASRSSMLRARTASSNAAR
jgi:hypothetical protein